MVSKLKMKLLETKVTQRELARRVKISESMISNFVNEWREPDDTMKKKIAKALKTKIEHIF